MSDPNNPDGCNPCLTGNGPPPTLCDGDTSNNYWVEGGICMLDTMTKTQVVYSIEHNPKARDDLKRVTTCEELLELLVHVPLLSTTQEDDEQQKMLNRTDSLPFYTVFRGNTNDM